MEAFASCVIIHVHNMMYETLTVHEIHVYMNVTHQEEIVGNELYKHCYFESTIMYTYACTSVRSQVHTHVCL